MKTKGRRTIVRNLMDQRPRARTRVAHYNTFSSLSTVENSLRFIREGLDSLATDRNRFRKRAALNQLLKYVPVSTISCIESFFRDVVQELVDYGEPYEPRAAELVESSPAKLDYDVLWAVRGKQFTLGEFVSHIVPLNSLETINSAISRLLDQDFLAVLQDVELTSRWWQTDKIPLSVRNIRENTAKIYADVKRTFQLRHLFAHAAPELLKGEFGSEIGEIVHCFESSKVFLIASDIYLFRLLHPGEPEYPTRAQIKEYRARKYREAEEKLRDALIEYREYLSPDRVRELEEYQKHWSKFADLRARFEEKNKYEDFYTVCLTGVTTARVQEIREAIELEEARVRMKQEYPKSLSSAPKSRASVVKRARG